MFFALVSLWMSANVKNRSEGAKFHHTDRTAFTFTQWNDANSIFGGSFVSWVRTRTPIRSCLRTVTCNMEYPLKIEFILHLVMYKQRQTKILLIWCTTFKTLLKFNICTGIWLTSVWYVDTISFYPHLLKPCTYQATGNKCKEF